MNGPDLIRDLCRFRIRAASNIGKSNRGSDMTPETTSPASVFVYNQYCPKAYSRLQALRSVPMLPYELQLRCSRKEPARMKLHFSQLSASNYSLTIDAIEIFRRLTSIFFPVAYPKLGLSKCTIFVEPIFGV